MKNWGFLCIATTTLLLLGTCSPSIQRIGKLAPGFQASQMYFVDNDGLFLLSNTSIFAFGFATTASDVTLFLLVVVHMSSSTVVWTANRGTPVRNSDTFQFDTTGNAYLVSGGSKIWSTNTAHKRVSAMSLQDSGNLALVSDDDVVVWQSFSRPTDTLLSNQEFSQGMMLVSDPGSNNITYSLEIKSGDMILSANFRPPQPYWSMGSDRRLTINKGGGGVTGVTSAALTSNSWKFYDPNRALLWQFIFADLSNDTSTWVAVLGSKGFVTFTMLQQGSSNPSPSPTTIPQDQCGTPASCDPYYICYPGNMCQCPTGFPSCKSLSAAPSCSHSSELVSGGDGVGYFALKFVKPFSKTTLDGCKDSCLRNCSCGVVFFEASSGNCFMFNEIGSMMGSDKGADFTSYVKIRGGGVKLKLKTGKQFPVVVTVTIIVILTVFVILGLIFVWFHFNFKRKVDQESRKDSSDEDNFLASLSGMPVRFTYKELEDATSNFSVKLGQGGFGSVYRGNLRDGTCLAVKKLEGISQGKKEFRAEVSIIGSIHHLHLVRIRGFCAEGSHRLLAYEYMANGSLDKWLFRKERDDEFWLDWNTRYNIAVGTAKGLAYLHEDCDVKIVHCDVKPENVLLDGNFTAKVSDFGLAKLMSREQSQVFTTLRGTRGYLAPEWITSCAISEKSDVYSYGMVVLELIGGRKNFDPAAEWCGKANFPAYALRMLEEGKLGEVVDVGMSVDERVEVAVKVALWCIQEDVNLRPPMTRVVQMLEGVAEVPPPPLGRSRVYGGFERPISEEGTSSGPSDCNSEGYLSAMRLSGPR